MKERRKFRQARKGEVICRCSAYKFPHRLMGGKCDGSHWVHDYLYTNMSGCTECRHWDGWCQVDKGQEAAHKCPALIEFLQFEEVPVPKKYDMRSWD